MGLASAHEKRRWIALMGEKFQNTLWSRYREMKRESLDGRALIRASLERARSKGDKLYVFYLLAHECEDQGDLDGAEDAHKRQIELDPRSPPAWTALGNFYVRCRSDSDAALACIDTAVACANELNNLVLFAHNDRLRVACALGRRDLAEDSLEKIRDYRRERQPENWELDRSVVAELERLGVRADLLEALVARIDALAALPR